MSFYVLEDLKTSPRRELFKVLGIPYLVTPYAWIAPLWQITLGVLLAWFLLPQQPPLSRLLSGLVYGMMHVLMYFLHGVGHILSGKLVGSPMKANLLTATMYVNQYEDIEELPSRIHIGRALGGGLFNGLVGLLCLAIYQWWLPSHFLLFFAVINVLFIGTLLPLPSADGEVLIREFKRWRARPSH